MRPLLSLAAAVEGARRTMPRLLQRSDMHAFTDTHRRACACGRARGTLAHRVVAQALNLDDIAFFLWWLTFAALTKIGDNPNATVFLEVLVKRSLHASDAVVPGLAEADAALRAMLHPHAESWYMQSTPPSWRNRCATRIRRWHLRTARGVCKRGGSACCSVRCGLAQSPHKRAQQARTARTHNCAHRTRSHARPHTRRCHVAHVRLVARAQ